MISKLAERVSFWFVDRFSFKEVLATPEGIMLSVSNESGLDPVREKPQAQPAWDHEEKALLVVEYFYYKNSADGIIKSNKFISELLRKRGKKLGIAVGEKYRNYRGIEAQRENLSHFDPDYKGALSGHESKWMQEIMQEYLNNPESLKREAYELVKKYAID